MRRRRTAGLAMAPLGLVLLLAACSGESGPSSSSGRQTSSMPTSSASPSSFPTQTTPPETTNGERVYHGVILGSGLTCVKFTDSHGKAYALTGEGVTPKVRSLSHSGYRRTSPTAPPNQRMIARVTVVGHVEPHAMNTCSYTTLVASKVTIESEARYTGAPPPPPATA